ncbi:MAG TPA: hypothetical protein VEC96_05755 [Anaerolineae bacterium]|nr:hypothetical protein [Anaerolineae bacterium]
MSQHSGKKRPFNPQTVILIGILIVIGLMIIVTGQFFWIVGARKSPPTALVTVVTTVKEDTPEVSLVTVTVEGQKSTSTPLVPIDETLPTPAPGDTPTATPTPTPTLDLDSCNAAGCGAAAAPLPPAEYNENIFLTTKTPTRRICPKCPQNELLSEASLNKLIAADATTLARLREIALSQETYELAPGIVYIVFHNVHHIVIDLKESGYVLRNIIPNNSKRGTLITPSYCLSPKSLVVTTADYHGLNGSNKTETGRDLFFHLGRAALYQRNGRFNIDVIRGRPAWERTNISWGGGPIFMWQGRYNYNPEEEWFDEENLKHYRTTLWTKLTAAISKERKYLFISASYGLTLKEHAQNLIDLGQRWGIKVDRAMRFDGSESGYIAIRLGDTMVPILNLEEPMIVNCFAIERAE